MLMKNRVSRSFLFFGVLVTLGLLGVSARSSHIPEPAAMLVMGSGLVGGAASIRRRLNDSR
jgi:hypothetical protein